MTTQATVIIASARGLLSDDAGTRWADAECFKWLSEAETVTVLLKPSANTVSGDITLVAGSVQTPPANFLLLDRPLCNLSGTTPGKAPKLLSAKLFDSVMPNWRTATAASVVDVVLTEAGSPKSLSVFPPQPVGTSQKLTILYAAKPTVISAGSQAITLADEYVPALVDYLVYRCAMKDIGIPDSAQRSAQALTSFASKLGVSSSKADAAARSQQ